VREVLIRYPFYLFFFFNMIHGYFSIMSWRGEMWGRFLIIYPFPFLRNYDSWIHFHYAMVTSNERMVHLHGAHGMTSLVGVGRIQSNGIFQFLSPYIYPQEFMCEAKLHISPRIHVWSNKAPNRLRVWRENVEWSGELGKCWEFL